MYSFLRTYEKSQQRCLLPLLISPFFGQIPIIQAPIPHAEDLKRAGMGKEAQPMVKVNQSKDDLTIKDVVSKAKDSEAKSKAGDAHPKAVDSKKDPPQAKT